jgi:pyrroloquinoline quinone biosynthesis protein B
MKLIVLGSAAGGGFPQWNCNCRQCAGVRAGQPGLRRRTQSSVIVGEGDAWVLVNASPDILQQIQATPVLQPGRGLRDSGIAGVLLVDGQIDHTTGLFMLRERGAALPLWCTDPVHADLTEGNPILRVLEHFCGVERHRVTPDGVPFDIPGVAGLRVRALPLWSKPAPFSPHRELGVVGDNVGYLFENTASGRKLFYAPGLAEIDATVWEAMQMADVVMVDGTFWTDDEMIRLGISGKRGSEIGHLPQSGAGGMLAWLSKLPATTRKLLIHINNTNPILDEHSPERAACTAAGVEVSHDGLEIEL